MFQHLLLAHTGTVLSPTIAGATNHATNHTLRSSVTTGTTFVHGTGRQQELPLACNGSNLRPSDRGFMTFQPHRPRLHSQSEQSYYIALLVVRDTTVPTAP
ncbi:hypothetical protein H4582DRAFT_2034274 [Lactarius indigo]|nr:hypothetical protein H4582DRAFT_2034274 [Lactarius indigo]